MQGSRFQCPECDCEISSVSVTQAIYNDAEKSWKQKSTKRYRECAKCDCRFTTKEIFDRITHSGLDPILQTGEQMELPYEF
jgi:transcriptional regulator NrdR family protein